MEKFDAHDIAEKIMAAIQKEYKELKTLNVMILGKTGVGKPVTQKIRKITKPDFPLAIYDTPGLELGGENAINTLLEEVISEIDKGIRSGDIGKPYIVFGIASARHHIELNRLRLISLKSFLVKQANMMCL